VSTVAVANPLWVLELRQCRVRLCTLSSETECGYLSEKTADFPKGCNMGENLFDAEDANRWLTRVERMNDSEVRRATESVAMLMSFVSGASVKNDMVVPHGGDKRIGGARARVKSSSTRVHGFAFDLLRGHLENAFCHGRIVSTDTASQISTSEDESVAWKCSAELGSVSEPLDFVAIPIDGIEDLGGGTPGAMTIVAAAPRGAFTQVDNLDYWVVAIGPKVYSDLIGNGGEINLAIDSPSSANAAQIVDQLVEHIYGSTRLRSSKASTPRVLTVATTPIGHSRRMVPWFDHLPSSHTRLHCCLGSRFAGAMKAFLPSTGIDIFVGQLSSAQASLSSVAALSTGSMLFALPVAPRPNRKDKDEFSPASPSWLTPREFLPDGVAFLSATGINDSPVADGVRQLGHGQLQTHTLFMSTSTRSVQMIRHTQNLEMVRFFNH
jgi:fructose-1,6-bisphosphatase II